MKRRLRRRRFRMRKLYLVLLSLVWVSAGFAQESKDAAATIEEVLNQQVAAWNRHDLEGFMSGYWKSPELTFFAGGQATSGWQAALERYRKSYQSPGKEMGKLTFSNLTVQVLGADAAFARGEFRLTMPDGKTPQGLFTLIFRKFPEGWKIVHDHSSSSQQ